MSRAARAGRLARNENERRVIVANAGRRVDADASAHRRFPLELVEVVRSRTTSTLSALGATTVVSAAACGADLIVLSAAAELGLDRWIVLPYDPAEFRARSVVDRPGPWGDPYDRFIAEARLADRLIVLDCDPSNDDAFLRANAAILDRAIECGRLAREPVTALAVWDGPGGGRSDFTADFVRDAEARGIGVRAITILARRDGERVLPPATDDVIDDANDPPADPLIAAPLEECDRVIKPAYVLADHLALGTQRGHRIVVLTSASLGALAIVVALLQLIPGAERLGTWELGIDVSFTAIGVLAVLLGIFASLQQRWYLQRHRAELLRLQKYRSLLGAAATVENDDSFEKWRGELADNVRRIRNIDHAAMQAWMEEKHTEPFSLPEHLADGALERLQALRTYYLRKRLDFQETYFFRKTRQYRATDRWLRAAPPIFFILSVVFACVHFAIAIPEALHGGAAPTAFPIVMSAICVVLAGMFRVVRSANEYARNTMRFSAKYFALVATGTRLENVTKAHEIATTLLDSERILEEEHREWLRLMHEAEWFG